MALRLCYKGQTSVPVEIEGLTPESVRTQTVSDIERFEIFHGNEKLPLAEMFEVSGDAADGRFDMEGDLSGVHWIGAHMREGEIHVHGNAGRHLGSELYGGQIHVEGNAGDWVGGEMHGGLIHVHGRAGHLIGAAYRGSARGMTGGTLIIDGDVGNEIGHTMRRGMIAIGGSAGDMVAFNMIAGSLLILGDCGIRPGAGMHRGTIAMFGSDLPDLLPSFRFACRTRPVVLPLMLRHLERSGMAIEQSLFETEVDVYNGDFIELGKGEILKRSPGA